MIALTPLGVDPGQQALMSEELLQAMHDGKTRLYADMVDRVSNGEQRILSDTGHSQFVFERVDAVVQAVRDVVDRAGRAWTRPGHTRRRNRSERCSRSVDSRQPQA